MKARHGIVILLMGGLFGSGAAWAQGFDEVLATQHNFIPRGAKASPLDYCFVCHAEMVNSFEDKKAALPWNSKNSTVAFNPSVQVRPPLGKGGPDHRPYGPSFHCLSCHDGALGSDVHQIGFSSGRADAREQEMSAAQDGARAPDHPDSILYPRRPSGEFLEHRADPNLARYWSIPDRTEDGVVIPAGPSSAQLGLEKIDSTDPDETSGLVRTFMGAMHCDTCHNPHIDQNRPFLRLPARDLCLVCHQR